MLFTGFLIVNAFCVALSLFICLHISVLANKISLWARHARPSVRIFLLDIYWAIGLEMNYIWNEVEEQEEELRSTWYRLVLNICVEKPTSRFLINKLCTACNILNPLGSATDRIGRETVLDTVRKIGIKTSFLYILKNTDPTSTNDLQLNIF